MAESHCWPVFKILPQIMKSGRTRLREVVDIHIKGNPLSVPTHYVTDEHRDRWRIDYIKFRSGLTLWQRWRLRRDYPMFAGTDLALLRQQARQKDTDEAGARLWAKIEEEKRAAASSPPIVEKTELRAALEQAIPKSDGPIDYGYDNTRG